MNSPGSDLAKFPQIISIYGTSSLLSFKSEIASFEDDSFLYNSLKTSFLGCFVVLKTFKCFQNAEKSSLRSHSCNNLSSGEHANKNAPMPSLDDLATAILIMSTCFLLSWLLETRWVNRDQHFHEQLKRFFVNIFPSNSDPDEGRLAHFDQLSHLLWPDFASFRATCSILTHRPCWRISARLVSRKGSMNGTPTASSRKPVWRCCSSCLGTEGRIGSPWTCQPQGDIGTTLKPPLRQEKGT